MEEENELNHLQKGENEEEDASFYFLQPASSPYNIAEKVQQANFDLFNSTPQSARPAKVKFREELMSFEPDLTDDDVNSIESDQMPPDVPVSIEEARIPYNLRGRGGMDIYDIDEEIDDAVLEELVLSDDDVPENIFNEMDSFPDNLSLMDSNNFEEDKRAIVEHVSKDSKPELAGSTRKPTKREKPSRKFQRPVEVNCKEHCIERLDTNLSMSISKLAIYESKPTVNLPPLQLLQRHCCDDKQSNSDRNLPKYNGYRSEYGLSSRQMKNRERHMEMIRRKELARQKIMEEYRALKVQQNEEIFCEWLKQVSRRSKISKEKKGASPEIYYVSPEERKMQSQATGKTRERPKTAGFLPKTTIKKKKRPHSTQSCVYIEVPPTVLKKGLYIGDLLVTHSKEINKKLHILTVS